MLKRFAHRLELTTCHTMRHSLSGCLGTAVELVEGPDLLESIPMQVLFCLLYDATTGPLSE